MDPVIDRYARRASPRYTSYPTAPHFGKDVDEICYRGWLAALDPSVPVSLYLHVPFCRQMCWYCGCNMKLASRYDPVADYARTLRKEIALTAAALPDRMTVSHLHWGGGTPTALSPDDLAILMGDVRARWDFAPDAEIAIESDPRTLTPEMAARIGALGFTRASFGVQEFDMKVQKAINRVQPPAMVQASVEQLRAGGVSGINFDLIYGLPYQTVETLVETVKLSAGMRLTGCAVRLCPCAVDGQESAHDRRIRFAGCRRTRGSGKRSSRGAGRRRLCRHRAGPFRAARR